MQTTACMAFLKTKSPWIYYCHRWKSTKPLLTLSFIQFYKSFVYRKMTIKKLGQNEETKNSKIISIE